MTPAATGNVNNFINRPRPPLIEQKHTNNMEKHFLFFNAALPVICRPDIQSARDWNRNDKDWALIDAQLHCLLYRLMTHASALNLHFLPVSGRNNHQLCGRLWRLVITSKPFMWHSRHECRLYLIQATTAQVLLLFGLFEETCYSYCCRLRL